MQKNYRSKPIEKITKPFQRFIQQERSGGLLLGISVVIALILANSALSPYYHHFLEQTFGLEWNGKSYFNFTIHHWINDGLMSVFFFVVGLELKREIIVGELSNPRKAMLPIVAAIGGMVVPAFIFLILNPSGEVHKGWGIPMATDIAFALGVLFLLGKKVPLSLKVFLTALAVVDDLGAVLVIAFFYTSNIETTYLFLGLLILGVMYLGNKAGIRSLFFYALLGILGVWICFVISGVHATIAAVLAAFVIPADVKITETIFVSKINDYLNQFKNIDPQNSSNTLTNDQIHILETINNTVIDAMPPSQRLEHALHPVVTFLIIPIFALANAGVNLVNINFQTLFENNIALGVFCGLLLGKVIGVVGLTAAFVKLRIAQLPDGMNFRNLLGVGFLASIGFTMSLFITALAYSDAEYQTQSKIGIFAASLIGGIIGYNILNLRSKK